MSYLWPAIFVGVYLFSRPARFHIEMYRFFFFEKGVGLEKDFKNGG